MKYMEKTVSVWNMVSGRIQHPRMLGEERGGVEEEAFRQPWSDLHPLDRPHHTNHSPSHPPILHHVLILQRAVSSVHVYLRR